VCLDVRGVNHLHVYRSPIPSQLSEQVFPDPASGPADKAVIDRRRRAILRRAVAPATTALQHVHDAADDAAIIGSFDTAYVRRQVRFDPLIAQPKEISAHDPDPLHETDHDRIVRADELMSFDPS
jgi:hypothetical protein